MMMFGDVPFMVTLIYDASRGATAPGTCRARGHRWVQGSLLFTWVHLGHFLR